MPRKSMPSAAYSAPAAAMAAWRAPLPACAPYNPEKASSSGPGSAPSTSTGSARSVTPRRESAASSAGT